MGGLLTTETYFSLLQRLGSLRYKALVDSTSAEGPLPGS